MDPYIEAGELWGDFHFHLVGEIKRALAQALPERYAVRTASRSYTEIRYSESDSGQPVPRQVLVAGAETPPGHPPADDIDEPVRLRALSPEDHRETFLSIYDFETEKRLVTRIELLSPSNTQRGSEGWKKYLRKRRALLLGKANLVEIDLLRGGDRMPMLDPLPDSPYYLLVAREQWAPTCRVWRGFFDRPLPTIPVPLSKPDPDIPLSLQPMVEAVYERSRYAEDIDYSRPLTPPLTAEQEAWLRGRLREQEPSGKPPPRKRRR
jgi:hypothetical protein